MTLTLIEILANLLNVDSENFERSISVMTAHGSKGQEAHRVIILDVTQKQFPKIHPDNLLFEVFGVTPRAVLEEERRLFYVAMTRAEHALYFVTDKDNESLYLDVIRDLSVIPHKEEESPPLFRASSICSGLAARIHKYTEKIDAVGSTEKIVKHKIDPWAFVESNASSLWTQLIAFLRESGVPAPETEYYLPGEEDLVADLAWPKASPPVAVLSKENMAQCDEWTLRGWKVPPHDLPIEKIGAGIRYYVFNQMHEAPN